MKLNYFFLTCLIFISHFSIAQNSFWKYENTNAVLVTAIDIEAYIDLFSVNDYVEYITESDEVILYMYAANMKATNIKDENKKENFLLYEFKIIGDKLKLLIRSGVDNIYFIIFKKLNIDEGDFRNRIQSLKD